MDGLPLDRTDLGLEFENSDVNGRPVPAHGLATGMNDNSTFRTFLSVVFDVSDVVFDVSDVNDVFSVVFSVVFGRSDSY